MTNTISGKCPYDIARIASSLLRGEYVSEEDKEKYMDYIHNNSDEWMSDEIRSMNQIVIQK